MLTSNKLHKTKEENIDVYDISLDGTVINALGMNVMSNTDGFDFRMPELFRYTEENPYISIGKGRNYPKGKKYVGIIADIAEFEDLYLNNDNYLGINKMGLGLDDIIPASVQIGRKNYFEYLEDGSVKVVGNTLKSKKMPIYIEKFLDNALPMLLHGRGKDFLEYYYDYIERIYNLKIPLKDIATVGKIKTSLDAYKQSCRQLTAAGNKKARQAWYELAIRDNLQVNMGDTIYYINTGKKHSDSDVQRETIYYIPLPNGDKRYHAMENGDTKRDARGNPVPLVKAMKSEYEKAKKDRLKELGLKKFTKEQPFMTFGEFVRRKWPTAQEEDKITFNCIRLSTEIVEDEDDHYCDETFEYNYEKYIDMFNSRIRPLLVCFDRSIRTTLNEKGAEVDNILITNPRDRKTFTEEEAKLVSGQPYKLTDQDTYEALMTMEDKEIKFWISVDKEPPYAKECGIDWERVKNEYKRRMQKMQSDEIVAEVAKYEKIVDSLKKSDVNALIDEGKLPDALLKFLDEDMETGDLISKRHNVRIGTIFDLIDKDFSIEKYED